MINKQAEILQCAITLFSKNGYRSTSTNEIIELANVSKGLLFHYYGNKESLFCAVFEYVCQHFNKHLSQLHHNPQNLAQDLFQVMMHKQQYAQENPIYFKLLFEGLVHVPTTIEQRLHASLLPLQLEGTRILHEILDTIELKKPYTKQHLYALFEGMHIAYQQKIMPLLKESKDPSSLDYDTLFQEYLLFVNAILYGIQDPK